jgi:hypothetical protein
MSNPNFLISEGCNKCIVNISRWQINGRQLSLLGTYTNHKKALWDREQNPLSIRTPRNQILVHVITSSLTHSWSWALLENLSIVQLLKNFPAFYGTRRFITVFTRALHWSLFWARSIQSIPYHPISLRSILKLSTYLRLGLPSGLFPSGDSDLY